ncbi:MAG: hypothetical protein Q8M20_00380 [Rhodocyclaceae bacterium]|nr:hypothetical protein [Rhodocyclaceae bacterium]MDZ4215642.1 hypothetical protein [Rhodocyclaceae bacterium]
MDSAPEIATTLQAWLRHFDAVLPVPTFCSGKECATEGGMVREVSAPQDPDTLIAALAALAAEALARDRSLWIITADDSLLPDLSNALDLQLRPLCLVMPGADYAGRITLRATLSLLKSRLTRAAADSEGPAWSAMRTRLQEQDRLWRASLAWSTRGLDREPPPPDIARLYPVRIGPATLATQLATPADWVILAEPGRLSSSYRMSWPGAQLTLLLDTAVIHGSTALAFLDENAQLRAEIEVLGQELAEMELELATAQGELALFSERYHALIADRIAEFDQLQAALARYRMQQSPDDPALENAAQSAEARAKQSRQESESFREQHGKGAQQETFSPSQDLKKRFRQLAQKIHPDRARDENERAWRTQLMTEANRAYRAGDTAALDELLALWQEGRAAKAPMSAEQMTRVSSATGLTQQATRIRLRIREISAELDRLYSSKLYELFSASRMAARQGRDLLAEIVERLESQIDAARAALDQQEVAEAA